MKIKTLFLTVCVILMLVPSASEAQQPESEPADTTGSSITVHGEDGRRLFSITGHEGDQDKDFTLSILGLKVDFSKEVPEKPRRWGSLLGQLKIGASRMTDPSYSIYPEDTPDFMDYRSGRSWGLEFSIFHTGWALNDKRNLHISTGLDFKWSSYRFRNRYTINKQEGIVVPVYIEEEWGNYRKSKFMYSALSIPVILRYNITDKFFIRGGGYMDIVVKQKTVVKKPKMVRVADYGMNIIQAGATLQIGFGSTFVYFNYGLVPMFKHKKGPRTNPYSFGIGFDLYSID